MFDVSDGVSTDALVCECGEPTCYFCADAYEMWLDEQLADYDAEIEAMGYGVNCERGCPAVDRRHCGMCQTCPGRPHEQFCELTEVIVPDTMEIILADNRMCWEPTMDEEPPF